jgi:hypothetical protein
VKADATKPGEYTSEFIAPPAMESLIDYGKKIGSSSSTHDDFWSFLR